MAVRLRAEFHSDNSDLYKIDLHDEEWLGGVHDFTVGGEGLSLDYQGGTDDLISPIISSELTFSIATRSGQTESYINDVKTYQESRFRIVVYKDSSIYWVGWVMQDLIEVEDAADPYFVIVKAVDGIGRLSNIEYEDANDISQGGGLRLTNIVDIAHKSLSKIGTRDLWGSTDTYLQTSADWWETSLMTYSATDNPLDDIALDVRIFQDYDGDGNIVNANVYDVLHQVATAFNARVYQADGRFVMEQYGQLDSSSRLVFKYDKTATFLSYETVTNDISIDQTSNAARLAGNMHNFIPAVSRAEVTYNQKFLDPWITTLPFDSARTQYSLGFIAGGTGTTLTLTGTVKYNTQVTGASYNDGVLMPIYRMEIRVEDVNNAGTYHYLRRDYNGIGGAGATYGNALWQTSQAYYYFDADDERTTDGELFIYNNLALSSLPLPVSGDLRVTIELYNVYKQPTGNLFTLGTNQTQTWFILANISREEDGAGAASSEVFIANNSSTGVDSGLILDVGSINIGDGLLQTGHLCAYNGTAWGSSSSWRKGSSGTGVSFLQLLVREALALHYLPIERYNGSISGDFSFGQRITFSSMELVMMGGSFGATGNTWSAEWFVIDRNTSTVGDGPIELGALRTPIGGGTSPTNGGTANDIPTGKIGGMVINLDNEKIGPFQQVTGGAAIVGGLKDGEGSFGSSGQVLSSTVTGLSWITSASSNDYVDGVTFNTSDGIVTLTRSGGLADLTVDLDGRYLTTHPAIPNSGSIDNSNGVVVQDITIDAYGHSTAWGTVDLDDRFMQLGDPQVVTVKNMEATATLAKGTPVYAVDPSSSGNIVGVKAADASSSAKMPAVVIMNESVTAGSEGEALIVGVITGVDTSSFTSGDVVYVASGGGFTNVKPTGTNLIQNLGVVMKVHATNGSGVIYGSGRANDVPNIPNSQAWVGNASGVATPTTLSITNWDTAYTYSTVGHLPLAGGTLTGDLTIEEASTPTLKLKDTTNNLIGQIRVANNWMYIDVDTDNTVASTRLIFRTDGVEALNINNSQNATFAGTITATGGTSTQWNTAYTYSTVGHLPLAGGTLTGDLAGTGASFSGQVTIPAVPVSNTDAASKQYIDNKVAGALIYLGTWNASTNTPTLVSGTGTVGTYYIVATDGTTTLDGISDWITGDWAVFSDLPTDAWQKIDNTSILGGAGTGGNIAAWSGSGTSVTLTDAPITYSGSNTTFGGRVIIGEDAITTDKPGLVVGDTTNGGQITIRGLSPTLFFDKTGVNNPKILTDGGLLEIKSGTLDSEGAVLMSLTGGVGNATFAGTIQSDDITIVDGTNDVNLNLANTSYGIRLDYSTGDMFLRTNGATRLTIANGGAATFAGTIAASNLSGTNTGDQDLSPYAPLASPTFTGSPRSVTPATASNDTSVATTAYVKAQGYSTTAGTVTSVAMTVPTGLTVSGTPITTSGTLAVVFASGYSIPTNTGQSNWNTAYTYSQVGHLPLAGGTLTGALTGTAATFAGVVTVEGAGAASYGSVNLESDDPFIRLYDNGTGSTTDKKKWDIRAIGATGYESFDIRTVNDANTVFSTKLSIAHNGNATFAGTITATGGTSTQWNTAYGWGDHAGLYLRLAGDTMAGTIEMDGNTINDGIFVTQGGASSDFVKGDGSLDSTAYLPLAGGTLSGALTGTTATFSGKVTAQKLSIQNQINTNSANLEINYENGDGTTTNFKTFSVRDGKNALVANFVGSTKATTLYGSLTGTAATFSGRLTLNSANYGDHLTIRRGVYGYDTIVTGTRVDFSPTASTDTFKFLANVQSTGTVTSPTFLGDLSGTINTATTAVTQAASNNSTKVATTAYADAAAAAVPVGDYLPLAGGTMSGDVDMGGNRITDGVFETQGGTSDDFVKGDGTLDSTGYLALTGGTLTGGLTGTAATFSGDVGVGTTSPDAKLEVAGGSTGILLSNLGDSSAYDAVRMTYSGYNSGTPEFILEPKTAPGSGTVNSYFRFKTSGSVGKNYANVTVDGKVGIGTQTPSSKLSIDSVQQDALSINSSDGDGPYAVWKRQNGNLGFVGNANALSLSGNTNFGVRATNDLVFAAGGSAERMRITSAGNVGIGTTTPQTKLQVNGDISVTSGDAYRMFNTAGTGWGEMSLNETDNIISFNRGIENTGNDWKLSENSADSFVCATQGDFGIGTTSPSSKLQVDGGIQMSDDTDTASASKVGTQRYRTSGSNSYVDMCMQTGASTYEWINILENNW